MSTVKKSKISKKTTHANAQRQGRIWIGGLVVIVAVLGFIAIYKRSTPVQAKLPDATSAVGEAGAAGTPSVTDPKPEKKDSESQMNTVAFEATVPSATPRPAKTPHACVR